MARSRLVTGAQVLVYINNTLFGRCAGVELSADTPVKETRGLDTLKPLELVSQGVSAGGVIHAYRLHKDGGLEAAGMIATWSDLTRQKYFNITVVDRVTDTVIWQANRCMVTGQRWNIARGHILVSANFMSLDWNNETVGSAG